MGKGLDALEGLGGVQLSIEDVGEKNVSLKPIPDLYGRARSSQSSCLYADYQAELMFCSVLAGAGGQPEDRDNCALRRAKIFLREM